MISTTRSSLRVCPCGEWWAESSLQGLGRGEEPPILAWLPGSCSQVNQRSRPLNDLFQQCLLSSPPPALWPRKSRLFKPQFCQLQMGENYLCPNHPIGNSETQMKKIVVSYTQVYNYISVILKKRISVSFINSKKMISHVWSGWWGSNMDFLRRI